MNQFDMNELICPRCGGEMKFVPVDGIPDADELCESYFCDLCGWHVAIYPADYDIEHYWNAGQ